MQVAKILSTSPPDVMKLEEGNDSLDTFIRQAVGKEPLWSFSRPGDNPVQLIQLLHALEQQEIPGWPLLSPMKIQLLKCDKCAREFCSSINYRRHTRVHRRPLNVYKEPHKNRELLGAFWDKLSLDEAKEIMSFNDVTLEELSGSSVVKAISSNRRNSIFLSLPQIYVKAGSTLVDIIQARLSRLPISSLELFSILDDASEKTFLCAGTAESLQKYVFDGEAVKIGLEMKNLIACASFLVEQKLVRAWLADKEAEALRCQTLLVEEEEAAQRRQAELLERKRQKKLRQKEQRAKDRSDVEKVELCATAEVSDCSPSAETSSPSSSTEVHVYAVETPMNCAQTPLEQAQFSNNGDALTDIERSGTSHNVEPKLQGFTNQHFVTRRHLQKSQKVGRNGFYSNNQNAHTSRREPVQRHGLTYRDQRAAPINGGRVWTKKPKMENGGELVRNRVHDAINQTDQSNCQLMIGSISVMVRDSTAVQQVNSPAEIQDSNSTEVKKSRTGRSIVKSWRPRNGIVGPSLDRSKSYEDEKGADQVSSGERCLQSCDVSGKFSESMVDAHQPLADAAQPEAMPFSSDAAKAFLAQRWKESISGEHVKLVLTSETELGDKPGSKAGCQSFDPPKFRIVSSTENHLTNTGAVELTTKGNVKTKFRRKPENGVKYIPKQRSVN